MSTADGFLESIVFGRNIVVTVELSGFKVTTSNFIAGEFNCSKHNRFRASNGNYKQLKLGEKRTLSNHVWFEFKNSITGFF